MAYIFEYLNHEFKGSIRDGNFYDLGLGTGMMKNIASKSNKECKSGTIIITFTND
jgi:hypothetical protein